MRRPYRRPISDPLLRLMYAGEADDEPFTDREPHLLLVRPESHTRERKMHRTHFEETLIPLSSSRDTVKL